MTKNNFYYIIKYSGSNKRQAMAMKNHRKRVKNMEIVQGKHFSITDPQGVNTIIYKINETEREYLKESPKYTIERLDYTEELRGDVKRKTFFVEEPKETEDLVILSFGKDRVVVNMGILEENKVIISKKPSSLKFQTLYSEEEKEFKDFKYTPNLKRPITIIAPETTEEIKPVLYFDKETNEVRGKCKLKPYKSYFTFEIKEDKY